MSMLTTITDAGLDILLQKEPTSKFLRGYIREITKTDRLPVCTSWEEWKDWFEQQPDLKGETKTPPPSATSQPVELNAVRSFVSNLENGVVTAYATVEYSITETNTHEENSNVNVDLSFISRTALANLLDPLTSCRSQHQIDEWLENDGLSEVADQILDAINDAISGDEQEFISQEGMLPERWDEIHDCTFSYDQDELSDVIYEALEELANSLKETLPMTVEEDDLEEDDLEEED